MTEDTQKQFWDLISQYASSPKFPLGDFLSTKVTAIYMRHKIGDPYQLEEFPEDHAVRLLKKKADMLKLDIEVGVLLWLTLMTFSLEHAYLELAKLKYMQERGNISKPFTMHEAVLVYSRGRNDEVIVKAIWDRHEVMFGKDFLEKLVL